MNRLFTSIIVCFVALTAIISITKVEDDNGNDISGLIFASREIVDFIETDY